MNGSPAGCRRTYSVSDLLLPGLTLLVSVHNMLAMHSCRLEMIRAAVEQQAHDVIAAVRAGGSNWQSPGCSVGMVLLRFRYCRHRQAAGSCRIDFHIEGRTVHHALRRLHPRLAAAGTYL
jgi:hypothetical protein